ncbi:MAG: O-antigen ligase family protein [Chryseobacterium sp.]
MDLIFNNYIKLTRFFIPLSVWYFLIDDGGGLSLKNSHIILILSLLTIPDIIILSKLNRNSMLLLGLLNVITLASFYNSNYKDQYPWGLRFTLLITLGYVIGMMLKGMSGILKTSLAIIAFLMTIPEGLHSWKVTLLTGEERLWRFLPWHNPTGIVYGAFFLIFTICIQQATKNIHKLLLAFFASASCSLLILSGSRASIYITLLFFIIYCIFFMGLKNSIINTGILFLLTISEISILVHQKGTFSKNGFDYSSGNAISSGSLSIFGRTSSAGDNFLARTKFWVNSIGIFRDNILLGSGPGSWASVSWFNRSPNETLSTAVHNDYLQFLAEYGLIFFFII